MNKTTKRRLRVALGIPISVAVIVAVGMYWSSQTYPELTNFIIGISVISGLFAFSVVFSLSAYLNSHTKPAWFSQDISLQNVQPDGSITTIMEQLEELDFSLIGSIGMPHSHDEDPKLQAWLMVDKQGFTQVMLRPKPQYPIFNTAFEDGFMLTTSQFNYVDTNQLESVYLSHQQKIADSTTEHGNPILLDTVSAYLAWEDEYGIQNRTRSLRRVSFMFAAFSLFVLSILLQTSLTIASLFTTIPSFINQVITILPFIIGTLLIFAAFASGIFGFNRQRQTKKRDS